MARRPSAVALALALALARPVAAHAHPQAISIQVDQHGFDGRPDYAIVVEAGHPVSLSFTYSEEPGQDNPHDIRIKGLGLDLPTVRLDRDHPTASVSFTPERTGTLRILCVIPCLGMENLVGARIRVERPKATGVPTILRLELEPREDGTVLARAVVRSSTGEPLADQPVIFRLATSVGGELELGAPLTMADGTAVARVPATGQDDVRVTAVYEGGAGRAYAETTESVRVERQPMDHRPPSLSQPTAPPVLAVSLLLVLGGIWSTYAYVVWQVLRLRESS